MMLCKSDRLPCPAGQNKISDSRWLHTRCTIWNSGINSKGNHFCSFDYGPEAPNRNSYHYSNENGSWFFSNPDRSTYYNDGKGFEQFTPAPAPEPYPPDSICDIDAYEDDPAPFGHNIHSNDRFPGRWLEGQTTVSVKKAEAVSTQHNRDIALKAEYEDVVVVKIEPHEDAGIDSDFAEEQDNEEEPKDEKFSEVSDEEGSIEEEYDDEMYDDEMCDEDVYDGEMYDGEMYDEEEYDDEDGTEEADGLLESTIPSFKKEPVAGANSPARTGLALVTA